MHWVTSDLFHDPAAHATGVHPERPERVAAARRGVEASPVLARSLRLAAPRPATREEILAVHSAPLLDGLERLARSGGGHADPDTVVTPRSVEVARLAAGAAIVAAELAAAAAGGDPRSFAVVRPPGHHASPDRAMGFCLFNNVAIAVRHAARAAGVRRALIVDFDVHHGNGTQDAFWEDPDVHFLSAHRFPFYPGTGSSSERGAGPGEGTTENLPFAAGTPPSIWLPRLFGAVEAAARRFRPEMIFASAGFDAYAGDPVGGLGLEPRHFSLIGAALRQAADAHCAGRFASVLEGGYALDALPACVAEYVAGAESAAASP